MTVRNSSSGCVPASNIIHTINLFQSSHDDDDEDRDTFTFDILHRNQHTKRTSAQETTTLNGNTGLYLASEKEGSDNRFEEATYIGGLAGIILGSIIVFPTVTVCLYFVVYQRIIRSLSKKQKTTTRPWQVDAAADKKDGRQRKPSSCCGQSDSNLERCGSKMSAGKENQTEGHRSISENEGCQSKRHVSHESPRNMKADADDIQVWMNSHREAADDRSLSVDEASD